VEDDDTFRLRYEHTFRGLDRQAVVLAELRTRASILLSATGIVTALLGSAALKGQAPLWISVIAILVTAGGLACCVAVLMPVHDKDPLSGCPSPDSCSRWRRLRAHVRPRRQDPRQWRITLDQDQIVGLAADVTRVSDLQRAIVAELGPARVTNYETIKMLTALLSIGGGLLIAQIAVWTGLLVAYPPMRP